MRVICIYQRPMFDPPQSNWLIKAGIIYEVISTFKSISGYDYYELSFQPGVAYCVEHFIPVSDIDETEMIRNYQTEKA